MSDNIGILIFLIVGLSLGGGIGLQLGKLIKPEESKCEIKREFKVMEYKEEFMSIVAMETLKKYVTSLNLESFASEKIIKTIDFELDIIKRGLIKKLGEEAYEKIRKGE